MIAQRTFLVVLVALGGSFTAGCGDTNDSRARRHRDRDRDGLPDRTDPRPNRPDYPDRDDDRYADRSDRPRGGSGRGLDEIPRDAFKVTEGSDEKLRHEPKLDGRVYVYDVDEDILVFDTRLRGGERFVLDPGRDELTIDGKRIDKVNLRPSHKYRIYYLRD